MDADDSQAERTFAGRDTDLRILVAEDNAITRKLLLGMLESLDYSADSVKDGRSVLSALAKQDYDLILMDCQMPGMDGDQVTREIRANRQLYRRQPIVIAITADVSEKNTAICLQAGMDGFIAKPLRLETLESGLRRWSSLAGKNTNDADAPNNASETTLDQDALSQLWDRAGANGESFLSNYIDLFLQDTTSRLEILRAALERKDHETLSRESHAVKGACLEFGVTRMSDCCDALRRASRDGHFDELPDVLRQLGHEFDRVKPVLESAKNRSV